MSLDKIIASIPEKTEAERTKIRANAERLLASGTPAQKVDARELLDALDAYEQEKRDEYAARVASQPMPKRIVEAFRKRPPTPTDVTVIRALLDNPASTSTTLSRACGWKGQIWHTHFGTMAKNREADLWPAEPSLTRDSNLYSGILASFDPVGSLFTMKPEAAIAFAELGIEASPKTLLRNG